MKNKLKEVLSIQSESYNQFRMFAYIIRQLNSIGCNYYTYNGCIYATKGKTDTYPCIASHMDTVHSIEENLTAVEVNGNITGINAVTMSQTGIGGDDKVGIFIALQCLESFDNIKAVFFRDEEVGCEGSYTSNKEFFDDCSFVLQCDRRGNTDFITNASGAQLSSTKFQDDVFPIISSYGYSFNVGMMTDVMALKQSGILCSMANISCGYYNPHCFDEYVNIADVFHCLEMVIDIIKSIGNGSYPCKYKEHKSSLHKSYDKIFADDEEYFYSSSKKVNVLCECCNEQSSLQFVHEYGIDMCEKCIKDYINF